MYFKELFVHRYNKELDENIVEEREYQQWNRDTAKGNNQHLWNNTR